MVNGYECPRYEWEVIRDDGTSVGSSLVGFGFGRAALGFGVLASFTFGSVATGTSAVLGLKARFAVA